MRFICIIVILSVLLLAGCANGSGSPSTPEPASNVAQRTQASPSSSSGSTIAVAHGETGRPAEPAAPSPPAAQGGAQGAGGLTWTSPKKWLIGPERPMRFATYRVPAAQGDTEEGECAVFFFGPGQGGGVEANIDRWIGQFEQPDGKPSAERAKRQTETVNGIPVSMIDLSGTYKGGPSMGANTPKTGYRLLGAIATGPQAGIFFKLTGPTKTVTAAEREFRAMLASLHQ